MDYVSQRSLRIPRAGIRVIFDASQKYRDVIHLEIGTPDLPTPALVCEAAQRAIRDGLTRYTANAGALALREAIASRLSQSRNLPVSAENIVVTTGGMGALASAAMATLDENDEVLVPDPGWPNYTMQALCAGATPVAYPLSNGNGFQPIVEELERRITSRTKVLIVNSPSNPIGTIHSKETIASIVELARRKNILIISDEVYEHIVYTDGYASYLNADSLDVVIGIYSFSKTYSMTGWRVGYLVSTPAMAAQITKLQEVFYACASSVSQEAARAALTLPASYHAEVLSRYRGRRDSVVSALQQRGIQHVIPEGTFYCMLGPLPSVDNSTKLALDVLDQTQVAIAPGVTFGAQSASMLRISFAVDEAILQEGIDRMAAFLASYRS